MEDVLPDAGTRMGCSCCDHDAPHESDDKNRGLIRVIAAAVLYGLAILLHFADPWGVMRLPWVEAIAFLIPYLIVGIGPIRGAVHGIIHLELLDEDFLMTIASLAAFAMGEHMEAVAVMLFFQVGELFEGYAVGKTRRSISDMMGIKANYATVERDGRPFRVDPTEVAVGEVIVVAAGERIPLDGVIAEGVGCVDTSALTGEAMPVEVMPGDEVLGGCVNASTLLRIRTTHPFEDSTVARILEMVQNASARKARAETFITRFAHVYTPIVVGAAVALAVIPPLFIGITNGQVWMDWVARACVFLVVSCPCALVISVPLSFFGGIGALSRKGVLVKGGNYVEGLARLETIVFDKTGTLTEGRFRVAAINPVAGVQREALLELAVTAESSSSHPIAQSIKEAHGSTHAVVHLDEVTEIAGHGLEVICERGTILAGNDRLMSRGGIAYPVVEEAGTVVHIALDGRYMGHLIILDEIKSPSAPAIVALRALGIRETIMLSGDKEEVVSRVATEVGIDTWYAQLLPGDKVEHVEELLAVREGKGTLAFVGDGINDAPVLMRADIGIAMGAMKSDAAVEAADVVIMDDDPRRIADGVRLSRATVAIARQNIVFALGIKVIVLVLGAVGLANMWMAVFADVGVSFLAILNAMRILKAK